MCNYCYLEPSEVKKIYARQGAVEIDDFDDEVKYRSSPKKKKKNREKTRPGCPENNYKQHIYVWTTEFEYEGFFYDYYGFHKRQSKICVGCLKKNGSKESDEYMKRKEREWAKLAVPEKGVPVSRWRYRGNYRVSFRFFSWEYRDEGYRKARNAYIDKHGYPKYLYI